MSYPWRQEWDGTCFVCAYFRVDPLSRAINPSFYPDDGLNVLCELHLVRRMDGLCVVCGQVEDEWNVAREGCIAVCGPCFIQNRGKSEALMFLAMDEKGDMPDWKPWYN